MATLPGRLQQKWAFLVGASEYRRVEKLRYGAADALEMQKSLQNNLGFPEQNIITLSDNSTLKPGMSEIFEQLGRVKEQGIGENDLLIFYFSGHGYYDPSTAEDYLLPIEATPFNIRRTAIRMSDVVEELKSTGCRNVVLFIDACREGVETSRGLEALGSASKSVVDREGMATFFSCDPRDRSFEISELGHGSFTYCLLEAIKKPDIRTVADLDKYLKANVPTINASYNKRPQRPFLVLNPQDILELPIFASRVVLEMAADTNTLIAKITDLFNEGSINAQSYAGVLVHLEQGRETLWDKAKSRLITSLCDGDLPPDQFMTTWAKLGKLSIPSSSEPARILPPNAFTRPEN
jgi:hypothetical protein